MVDSADVIRDIENVRFTPVRMREGYDMGEVDAFLDELVSAAREGRPFAPLVSAARFTTVRLREGYEIAEVDAYLAEVASTRPVPGERAGREAAASASARELAARIRQASFHSSFFKEGYATTDVEAFLEGLADAALEERPLGPVIASASFSRGRFRHGYVPEEVDGFLATLAHP